MNIIDVVSKASERVRNGGAHETIKYNGRDLICDGSQQSEGRVAAYMLLGNTSHLTKSSIQRELETDPLVAMQALLDGIKNFTHCISKSEDISMTGLNKAIGQKLLSSGCAPETFADTYLDLRDRLKAHADLAHVTVPQPRFNRSPSRQGGW